MKDVLERLLVLLTNKVAEKRLLWQLKDFLEKHRRGDEPILETLHRIDDALFGIDTHGLFTEIRSSLVELSIESSPQEQKNMAAEGSIVYRTKAFQDIVARIIRDTSELYVNKSESDIQRTFLRGQVSGADMVLEAMQLLDVQHQENVRQAQENTDENDYKYNVV